MPKSSGRPSVLTRILEEKLREYRERQRKIRDTKSQLHLTPEKENTGRKLFVLREGRLELNNTPALEKDIRRNNLFHLFYPRGNNTLTVPGYDPKNQSGSDYFLQRIIEKVLPNKYRTSLRYLQLKSQLRNLQATLPEKPTLRTVSKLKVRRP